MVIWPIHKTENGVKNLAFSLFLDSNFGNSDVDDNVYLVTKLLQSSREDWHILSISKNMKKWSFYYERIAFGIQFGLMLKCQPPKNSMGDFS